jgi:hypothetical protein
MFKLSISFNNIAELTAFVSKMGDKVIGGTVEHDQEIKTEVPAPKAPAKRAPAKKAVAVEEAVIPAAATNASGSPFPTGAVIDSFAPGNTPAPAVSQPAHIENVAPIQQAAPSFSPCRAA